MPKVEVRLLCCSHGNQTKDLSKEQYTDSVVVCKLGRNNQQQTTTIQKIYEISLVNFRGTAMNSASINVSLRWEGGSQHHMILFC